MLRKSILIGLFVLKNNRTIGEPKNLQGGVGKAIIPRCFFSGGYGRHREMEVFFARAVTGGAGVNGLKPLQATESHGLVYMLNLQFSCVWRKKQACSRTITAAEFIRMCRTIVYQRQSFWRTCSAHIDGG